MRIDVLSIVWFHDVCFAVGSYAFEYWGIIRSVFSQLDHQILLTLSRIHIYLLFLQSKQAKIAGVCEMIYIRFNISYIH